MSTGLHQRLDYKDMSYWAKQNVKSDNLFIAQLADEFLPGAW